MPDGSQGRRMHCTSAEVRLALAALDRTPQRIAASSWPGPLTDLDQPGLYSWWIDAGGAEELSAGLGLPVPTGRIYAGLTGATKWPSGKVGTMTLRDRIVAITCAGRSEARRSGGRLQPACATRFN